MKTSKKTNAARILDELHIPYELKTYPVDEEHLDAVHVAREVGGPGQQEQTLRTGTFKGTAAADRLYSWGLLALRR